MISQGEFQAIESTVKALSDQVDDLKRENASMYRTIGALVKVAGGEIKLPPADERDSLLRQMQLTTHLVEETGELVFKMKEIPSTNPPSSR